MGRATSAQQKSMALELACLVISSRSLVLLGRLWLSFGPLDGKDNEMIIRISARLGKKIHVTPAQSLSPDANDFADWSAHLFNAGRAQYILVTNTASLYSMLMYGKGITNDSVFLHRITSFMGEFMRDDGHEFIFKRLIAPATARVSFSKALNRGVTGSMNDLVYQAQVHLIEQEMSPYDASFLLNDVPMSYLKYETPGKAFQSLTLGNTEAPNQDQPGPT